MTDYKTILSKILDKYRIPINYILAMYEDEAMSEVVELVLAYLGQREPEAMKMLDGNVNWYKVLDNLDLRR